MEKVKNMIIIDNNRLIFEGEYLNGKRHGKGKEYDNNKIIFEGEYLNGKKHGKGKEYFSLDEIKKILNQKLKKWYWILLKFKLLSKLINNLFIYLFIYVY